METLQRTANRGSLSTGYDIDNSLKFESDNSERMSFTPSSAVASERRKHTISFWIKRTELGSTQYIYEWGSSEGDYLRNFLRFQSDDTLRYATSYNTIINTTRVFRDTSAWYHIVIQTDTVQSSNSDTKFWMYVNGELEASSTAFNVNDTMAFANNSQHDIGFTSVDNGAYGNYYLTEFNAVGGLKLAPTEFGEYDEDSGIWKPKAYTGSYGTNGFYLDFESSGSLGADSSGNGNDFTLNNITSADQATDTPTNNFCTMNALDRTDGNIRNQEGGTKITTDGGSSWCTMMATMGITKGKWYWEAQRASSDGNNIFAGVADSQDIYVPYSAAAKYYLGNVANSTSVGWYFDNGQVYNGDATFAAPSADDKVMIALDFDNQAIYFGVNGTWGNSSNPESGASKTGASVYAFNNANWDNFCMPAFTVYQGQSVKVNFGGYTCISISSGNSDEDGYGNFEYAPPSGYYALCSKNLAEYG